MQKETVTISIVGRRGQAVEIYSGPWNPEKVYKAECAAFLAWADKEGEDRDMAERLQDAQPVVEEVSRASSQMQEFFWWGNEGWHGPGMLLQEELEGYLINYFGLRYIHHHEAAVA